MRQRASSGHRVTTPTTAETHFEQFCREADLRLVPIPRSQRRTPDYELHVQEPPILVEVKEIDPNPQDTRALRTGRFEFSGVPGTRVREKIRVAASQLRAHRKPTWPGLVVIHNNVHPILPVTDPHAIMAAMHGQFEVRLLRRHAPIARVEGAERRLGGRRRLTENSDTIVSAVAVLVDPQGRPDGGTTESCLVVYHNRFAAHPLALSVLRRPRVFQFQFQDRGPGEFPSWVAI